MRIRIQLLKKLKKNSWRVNSSCKNINSAQKKKTMEFVQIYFKNLHKLVVISNYRVFFCLYLSFKSYGDKKNLQSAVL